MTTQFPSHRRHVRAAVASAAAVLSMNAPVHALEVTGGDYEVYPTGVNIAPLYFQHAERSDLYVNGSKVSSNFVVKSDIGIFRYIHPVQLSPTAVLDPQVILPFGRVKGSGDAAVLGSASGTADLILGAPSSSCSMPRRATPSAWAPSCTSRPGATTTPSR